MIGRSREEQQELEAALSPERLARYTAVMDRRRAAALTAYAARELAIAGGEDPVDAGSDFDITMGLFEANEVARALFEYGYTGSASQIGIGALVYGLGALRSAGEEDEKIQALVEAFLGPLQSHARCVGCGETKPSVDSPVSHKPGCAAAAFVQAGEH